MEENKLVEQPKKIEQKEKVQKVKKAPAKKDVKAVKAVKASIIQTNFARGFFVTGFLATVFYSLVEIGIFTSFLGSNINEFLLNTELQISIGLFLIGAFSFTRK